MPTTTMNISLPEEMKAFVEAQAASGRYSNASDYVRDLIRHAQDEQTHGAEALRRSIIEAGAQIERGEVRELDDVAEELHRRIDQRL